LDANLVVGEKPASVSDSKRDAPTILPLPSAARITNGPLQNAIDQYQARITGAARPIAGPTRQVQNLSRGHAGFGGEILGGHARRGAQEGSELPDVVIGMGFAEARHGGHLHTIPDEPKHLVHARVAPRVEEIHRRRIEPLRDVGRFETWPAVAYHAILAE